MYETCKDCGRPIYWVGSLRYETCKDCGRRIYWVGFLRLWYHWNQIDMLTCTADTITPASAEAEA